MIVYVIIHINIIIAAKLAIKENKATFFSDLTNVEGMHIHAASNL